MVKIICSRQEPPSPTIQYYSIQSAYHLIEESMTLWALASRRIIPGTVQRSSTVAAAIGGTRQMSVADKDNILPVSFFYNERESRYCFICPFAVIQLDDYSSVTLSILM